MMNMQTDMETILHNIKPEAIGVQQLQNNWKEVAYICHHIATDVPEIRRINKLKDRLNSFTGRSSLVAIKHNGSSIEMGLISPKNADWSKLCLGKDHTRTFSIFPFFLTCRGSCCSKRPNGFGLTHHSGYEDSE